MVSRAAFLRAPVRIDFCGGFTDVPEIARVTGTSIVNAAVDLYEDAERTRPVGFAVELRRRRGAPPHVHSAADAALLKSFTKYLGGGIDGCRDLRIHRELPLSTGLGSSGALSVMLAAACSISRDRRCDDPQDLATRAHDFECRFLGLKGGYQDYLSAAAGGCHRFVAEPSERVPRVHRRCLPERFGDYLDRAVFVVVAPRPCPSSSILLDLIGRLWSDADLDRRLRGIKACNDELADAMAADDFNAGLRIIDVAAELRRGISQHTSNPALDDVREELRPLCQAVHETGAGGASLAVYPREDALGAVHRRLAGLQQRLDIRVFFPKHNRHGLRVAASAP